MKKIFYVLLLSTLFLQVHAQDEKNFDVVLKLNGEEHIGKVTEMDDTSVKFVHKDETLSYTFKKADIMKITFASGRIEIINESSKTKEDNSTKSGSLESHHNKIAILPFTYLIDKQSAGEEISYKVQNECFSFLNNHVGELKIQDPMTTNASLIKAAITQENMRGYTMGEICNILGVEYVVSGTVTQSETYVSNYSGSSTNAKSNKGKNNKGNIFKSSTSTYSSSVQKYETAITMNIYTDKNSTIFSKDHTSFWQTDDAYKITLQYLLKRTPLYKK